MMPFIKKNAAALLCVMLVIIVVACVQQPSDPGAGRNVAQGDLSALDDDEDVLIFEADSKENLLNKAYIVARLESLKLYLLREAKAISPKEYDAEEKRLREKWVQVEKLADEVIRMYSSPVSSLDLWEQFRRLLAPQEAWAGRMSKAALDKGKADLAARIAAGAYVYKSGAAKQAEKEQGMRLAGGAVTAATGVTAILTAPATGPLAPVVVLGGIATTMHGAFQMMLSGEGKRADEMLAGVNAVDAALGWVNAPGAVKTALTNSNGLKKIAAIAGLASTADSTNTAATQLQQSQNRAAQGAAQNTTKTIKPRHSHSN